MECIRGLYNIRPRHCGAVATIGNFDGFHRGHRRLIDSLRERAAALQAPTLVMLFEPQPREYFQGAQARPRLMRLSAKLRALRDAQVDMVLVLRFDARLVALSATAFVDEILVKTLHIRALVIGDDFRFGTGRGGDFAMLRDAGERHGFSVESTATFTEADHRISSTRLRSALAAGALDEVQRLIGGPYRYRGRVVHGDARGRLIGFPTANVLMPDPPPLGGVFAVTAEGVGGRCYRGIANVGRRPTVGGGCVLLEVHLLDFAGDLYGQPLSVSFLKRLREERKFSSLGALQAQITADRDAARAFFAQHGVSS
ncbi:MAG TPA: bifunctional riboflavin kinase/FAD synthetase [Acidiferrobacter sp.]|nr:bifunctional riboflavin kinase/FAD synthetase [Acidiferrobacter sp.]